MKFINIKKIVSVILVAVLCSGVGFSAYTYESKVVGGNDPNDKDGDLISKTDKKDIKYYAVFDLTKDGKTTLSLEGLTETDYKYLKDEQKNNIYPNLEKAKAAYELNIHDKDEFDSEVIKIKSDPVKYKDEFLLITKAGYEPSPESYIKVSRQVETSNKLIDGYATELEKATDESIKADYRIKIAEEEKILQENQNFLNKNIPTVKQQGEILSSLTDDERTAMLDAINKEECKGSFIPMCEFFVGSTSDQAIKKSFLTNVNEFRYDENEKNDDGSLKSEQEQYNDHLLKQYLKNTHVDGLSCTKINECGASLDVLYTSCESSGTCTKEYLEKLDEARELLSTAEKIRQKETNWLFSVFDAINNQDQQARSSAKFFGFGADYDNIPNWLAEQGLAASQICIGEIDGYLDEDSSTGGTSVKESGSLTQYGYELGGSDYGEAGDQGTLDVVYDIRAKRTRITPDGTTSVTVSIYLKAPQNDNISYMLGLSYKTGDKFIEELLINKTAIDAGEIFGDLKTFDIEGIDRVNTHEGSFFIYLKARTGSGTVVANDNTNIYLVTQGDDNLVTADGTQVTGNNGGNSQDSTNEDVEQSTDTFWNGFDE